MGGCSASLCLCALPESSVGAAVPTLMCAWGRGGRRVLLGLPAFLGPECPCPWTRASSVLSSTFSLGRGPSPEGCPDGLAGPRVLLSCAGPGRHRGSARPLFCAHGDLHGGVAQSFMPLLTEDATGRCLPAPPAWLSARHLRAGPFDPPTAAVTRPPSV